MARSARSRRHFLCSQYWRKSLTLKGYLNGEITNDDAALERAKAFIARGLASGQLKPVIARTFPLEQIHEATRFLESNAQIGKVVVNV